MTTGPKGLKDRGLRPLEDRPSASRQQIMGRAHSEETKAQTVVRGSPRRAGLEERPAGRDSRQKHQTFNPCGHQVLWLYYVVASSAAILK